MPEARKPLALVIDDDTDMNDMIGAYVEISGLRYHGAATGLAGLADLSATPPDVVLLDVMLPDLDGFEVCRRIRENPATHNVPVLMLTALSDTASKDRGRLAGANEFLTKPFDPGVLIEMLHRYSTVPADRR